MDQLKFIIQQKGPSHTVNSKGKEEKIFTSHNNKLKSSSQNKRLIEGLL